MLKATHIFEEQAEEDGIKNPFRVKRSKRIPFLDEARAAKIRGRLVLLFYMGYDGRLESPMILQPVGVGVEAVVLRTLAAWRFKVPEGYEAGERQQIVFPIKFDYK